MLEVKNLCKSFNGKKILHDINFSVNSGEIVAYTGPNGAGKTTTINILTTLLKPTSGMVFLNGYNVVKDSKKIRQVIGYVFEDFGLYPSLSVINNLDFIGKLYKLSEGERRRKIKEIIEFFDLREYKKTPISKLSKGTKQKVSIAKALLHDPEILFLDEPTSGLDPLTAKNIMNLVLSLKKEGKTILMTTHLLNRAEMVSDRIILINKGKIVYNGKTSEIKRKNNNNSVEDLYFTLIGDKND
ncbi:MAG: putative ABC transporter ATP-binding protein YbhF [Candidatus Heimdallarchaeota archaeon LC_3]|nr:MAG: putative ABC transporter ATP-binding protein YbhF [Candidatus Heimdallarchaeota archaeon LC_3]